MAETSASSSRNNNDNCSSPSITKLDIDSLVHCANYLSIQDLSNMAMSSKFLRTAAYSDAIWRRLFREKWPDQMLGHNASGLQVRESYLNRRAAVWQFSFVDPLVADFYTDARPFSHVLLGKSSIVFSQGPLIRILKIDDLIHGRNLVVDLKDHKARITCMRLFATNEASFIRETPEGDSLLITSSSDHCIRLWWKDSCIRCLRGHSGPVSTLSNKLLSDGGSKVLASGGEDGTVRLWSLSSSGKRGKHALSATLYGHEKPVKLLSVSGHKPSLLVSVAMNSKIRVWDCALAPASRTSNCVGNTSLSGVPVGVKCFEYMLYVAAGSSVQAVDLRTMKKAFTAAVGHSNLSSFELLASRSLVCTGASNRALLWDIRKSQEGSKPEPMAILEGHKGPVTHIHMDAHKIVTGGPNDFYTNVWEVETGTRRTSLICCNADISNARTGCNALAVHGSRIVSVSSGEEGLVRFRDFSNASSTVKSYEDAVASKFWSSRSFSDSDSEL